MALVSFRLYVSEKFGQLARIFWANGLPPPWQKISRTPMDFYELFCKFYDKIKYDSDNIEDVLSDYEGYETDSE